MRNLILITTLLGLYTHGVTAQVIDYVDDKYYKLEDGEVKPYKTIKDPYSSDLASLMVTSARNLKAIFRHQLTENKVKKMLTEKL